MENYKLTIGDGVITWVENAYPKKEILTVTCPKESKVSSYCKKYGINVSGKTTN